jgi:hypothetical protein
MFPRIDKGPIEYYLSIRPAYNVEKREECLRFRFETNEEFHHFQYQITIDHKLDNGAMEFVIKGLKPRGMTMPGVGRAITEIDVFKLRGHYDVNVFKPGKVLNSFSFSVKNLKPKIQNGITNEEAFLQVSADEVVGAA